VTRAEVVVALRKRSFASSALFLQTLDSIAAYPAVAAASSSAIPTYVLHIQHTERDIFHVALSSMEVGLWLVCLSLFYARSFPSARVFPAHVHDAPCCLRERGFAFVPLFGEHFARDFIASMGEDIAQRKKQRIAGEVEQFAMPQSGSSPWPSRLRALWHSLVADLARHVGVEPRQLRLLSGEIQHDIEGRPCLQLHVQDEKLLIAGRQKGEQAPYVHSSTRNQSQQHNVTSSRKLTSMLFISFLSLPACVFRL
jgi:hypothetical protein